MPVRGRRKANAGPLTMTDTEQKVRAVCLAAIMTVSVLIAGITFSGGAVAAGTAGNVSLSLNSAGNQATVTVDDADLNTAGNTQESIVVNVESGSESPSNLTAVGDTGEGASTWYQIALTFRVGDRNNDGSVTTADFGLQGAPDESISGLRTTKSGYYEVEVTDSGSATTDSSQETVTYQEIRTDSRPDLDNSEGATSFTTTSPVGDRNGDGQVTQADITWRSKADDEQINSFTPNSDGTVTLTIEDTVGGDDNTAEAFDYLDSETATLVENGQDSSIFSGTKTLTQSTDQPGVLKSLDGDAVTGVYYDQSASVRRFARQTLSLSSDTTAPTISSVNLGENSGDQTISFNSDEQLGGSISDVAVAVVGPKGATYSYTRSDFAESSLGGGSYGYTLKSPARQAYDDGDGTYGVEVKDAKDATGNNGGTNGEGTGLTDTYSYSSGGGGGGNTWINGTVTDSSGPLQSADVYSVGSMSEKTDTTDSNGVYNISVSAGTQYDVLALIPI